MLNVEVKNLVEVKKYLVQLPERTFKGAKKVFAKAVFSADAKTKDNATNILKVRTGSLRRSIVSSVSGSDLDTLQASVGSASKVGGVELVYAPLHEFGTDDLPGGAIKAKKAYKRVPGGPYLNIPTKANKTPAGVTRLQAREVFKKGGYIRGTGPGKYGVFLNIPAKAKKTPAKAKKTPAGVIKKKVSEQMMFTLKKQVVIPARLGMIKAAEDEVPTILSRLANLIGED